MDTDFVPAIVQPTMSTIRLEDEIDKATRPPQRRRLVNKDGEVNVRIAEVSNRKLLTRDLFDFYTTLVDLTWGKLLMLIFVTLISSWLLFAGLWFGVASIRGDSGYRNQPSEGTKSNNNETTYEPCVENVDSFVSAVMFSVELQTSIGFGSRFPTERCPETLLLLIIQTVVGVVLTSTVGALLAGKFIRPNRRKYALKFSKYAVLDGVSFSHGSKLAIRLYDLRQRSRIIVQQVWGILIRNTSHHNSDSPKFTTFKVRFKTPQRLAVGSILSTVFPVTLVHDIDSKSPLLNVDTSAMSTEGYTFELVIAVDGVMEHNGLTFRKVTSYLPNEIKLGHEFEDFKGTFIDNWYAIDYRILESVKPVFIRKIEKQEV